MSNIVQSPSDQAENVIHITSEINHPFTMVDNRLIDAINLGPSAMRLYLYLSSHRCNYHPTQKTICEHTGLSRDTVIRAKQELAGFNMINIQIKTNKYGGKIHQIIVNDADEWTGIEYSNPRSKGASRKNRPAASQNLRPGASRKNRPNKNTKNKIPIENSSSSENQIDAPTTTMSRKAYLSGVCETIHGNGKPYFNDRGQQVKRSYCFETYRKLYGAVLDELGHDEFDRRYLELIGTITPGMVPPKRVNEVLRILRQGSE